MKDTRASRRVPCHKTRGILEQMMKTALLILACALLTACASSRYVAVQPAGGGGYYIAQTPPVSNQMRYQAGYYSPFYAYGLYPWWSYTYFSPNFYPHYFALSYPTWPYYGGGFGGWYGGYGYGYGYGFGGHPYGFASHGDYPPGLLPARTPVVPAAVPPAPLAPARVVAPTVVREGRERNMDTWNRHRGFTQPRSAKFQPAEPYLAPRHKPFATSPSTAPAIRSFDSVGRPSLPSYSPPPPTGSSPGGLGRAAGRAGQALDRSPLEHDP